MKIASIGIHNQLKVTCVQIWNELSSERNRTCVVSIDINYKFNSNTNWLRIVFNSNTNWLRILFNSNTN